MATSSDKALGHPWYGSQQQWRDAGSRHAEQQYRYCEHKISLAKRQCQQWGQIRSNMPWLPQWGHFIHRRCNSETNRCHMFQRRLHYSTMESIFKFQVKLANWAIISPKFGMLVTIWKTCLKERAEVSVNGCNFETLTRNWLQLSVIFGCLQSKV